MAASMLWEYIYKVKFILSSLPISVLADAVSPKFEFFTRIGSKSYALTFEQFFPSA